MPTIEWTISLGTMIHTVLTLGAVCAFGIRLTVIGVEVRARVNEIWREWRGTEMRDSFPVRMTKVEHEMKDLDNRLTLGDWRRRRDGS